MLEMPADSWMTLPGTMLAPFCTANGYSPGLTRCNNLLSINSAAFDSDNRRLLVFGGGYSYGGNEVYSFDLATASWQLIVPPSDQAQVTPNIDPYADGRPAGRATFGGLAYVSGSRQLFDFGGAKYSSGNSTDTAWTLDLTTQAWRRRTDYSIPHAVGLFWMATAYDPATETIFIRNEAGIITYELAADRWTHVIDFGYPPYDDLGSDYKRAGFIVPSRRLFFSIGGLTRSNAPSIVVFDLETRTDTTGAWITTGDTSVAASTMGPGSDYDMATDAIVAWSDGSPAILDLSSKVWTRGSAVGAPAPDPLGTFGRWRYVPYLNVFVLLNRANEDVYVYKHTAGCG